MKKTLYLLRHAKSSWRQIGLEDFDRPLNERGRCNAPEMGRFFALRSIRPDALIASTAVRAAQTAELVAPELEYPLQDIFWKAELYHASSGQILQVVRELAPRWSQVMLVGHNPGLTEFVNAYSDCRLDNLPTCALAVIEFGVERWSDIGEPGTCQGLYAPKQVL